MITAELNQTRLSGGQCYPHHLLDSVLKKVEQMVGKRTYHVSIAFVSPQAIRQANNMYRGKDRVTDVLSFGLEKDSGELLLCYEQAVKQAKDMHHSTRHEITFLMVHGLLHLFGHDHERPQEAQKMFALQEKILTQLNINPRLSV